MKNIKKLLIFIGALYVVYVTITILVIGLGKPIAFKVCLNGCHLSNEENVVSYGEARDGPWMIIKDEEELYKCIVKGDNVKLLENSARASAPKNIQNMISPGIEGVIKKIRAGHYLYIVRESNKIIIWSVTL
jgi:hypothetical protein